MADISKIRTHLESRTRPNGVAASAVFHEYLGTMASRIVRRWELGNAGRAAVVRPAHQLFDEVRCVDGAVPLGEEQRGHDLIYVAAMYVWIALPTVLIQHNAYFNQLVAVLHCRSRPKVDSILINRRLSRFGVAPQLWHFYEAPTRPGPIGPARATPEVLPSKSRGAGIARLR